jgi:hypothetical protein
MDSTNFHSRVLDMDISSMVKIFSNKRREVNVIGRQGESNGLRRLNMKGLKSREA